MASLADFLDENTPLAVRTSVTELSSIINRYALPNEDQILVPILGIEGVLKGLEGDYDKISELSPVFLDSYQFGVDKSRDKLFKDSLPELKKELTRIKSELTGYLLDRIRASEEFPYIAKSLAELLSRCKDFAGILPGALPVSELTKRDKPSHDLDSHIKLGIRYMLIERYEEAPQQFSQARSMTKDDHLIFALITVGSNILNAHRIYDQALHNIQYAKKSEGSVPQSSRQVN